MIRMMSFKMDMVVMELLSFWLSTKATEGLFRHYCKRVMLSFPTNLPWSSACDSRTPFRQFIISGHAEDLDYMMSLFWIRWIDVTIESCTSNPRSVSLTDQAQDAHFIERHFFSWQFLLSLLMYNVFVCVILFFNCSSSYQSLVSQTVCYCFWN